MTGREEPAEEVRYVTDGSRLLRAYLDNMDQSVPAFCEEHGIERIGLQRAMSGERRRVSVDLAKAVRIATRGKVPTESWSSDTGISAEGEKRVPEAEGSAARPRRRTGTGR